MKIIRKTSLLFTIVFLVGQTNAEEIEAKGNQAEHRQAMSDTKIGIHYILTKPMSPSDCKNAISLNKSLITKGELQVIHKGINVTNEFNEYCKEQ